LGWLIDPEEELVLSILPIALLLFLRIRAIAFLSQVLPNPSAFRLENCLVG
jgi:hypothetical protein